MSSLLYDALMLGRNKQVAAEEYQVATGRKEPAAFRADEDHIDIANVISDGEFSVHLRQEAPGYLEIEVSCEEHFIVYDRKVISTDEFANGVYEFKFMVISDRLHNGRNISAIYFRTSDQTVEVPVIINNRIRVMVSDVNPRERVFRLEQAFLQLHLGKLDIWEWARISQSLLDDIPGGDENSLYLMLCKAQVFITSGDNVHARNYIEHVGMQIPKLEQKNYNLYCYFVYLASLYEEVSGVRNNALRDALSPGYDADLSRTGAGNGPAGSPNGDYAGGYTGIAGYRLDEDPGEGPGDGLAVASVSRDFPDASLANFGDRYADRLANASADVDPGSGNIMELSALQKVQYMYKHNPSWNILWILFYMDPAYQQDPKLRFEAMRTMYYEDECISAVMYLEAVRAMRIAPELFTRAGRFEIHVLNFARKHNDLQQAESEQLARLILDQQAADLDPCDVLLASRILAAAWKRFGGQDVLHALCRMLAAAGQKDEANFEFFSEAVRLGILEEDNLAFYIYTIDKQSTHALPAAVLEYFLEHTELMYEYQSFVYAGIIRNQFANGQIYQDSMELITAYAEYQMSQGNIDEHLAVIYKDFLDNDRLTKVMKNHLFDILSTKEILCESSRMRSVLVFHKELQVYQESVLRRGKAFVKLYSTDALILFKDATGNIYHHIVYQIDRLLDTREYIDQSLLDVSISKYMLLGDTFPILRACRPALDILEFFTSHRMYGQFRQGYEQDLLNKVVTYYAKNSRDEQVFDELLKFREFDLLPQTRGRLIEIMLSRGLIDEAYQEILEFGPCELSAETYASLAHQYIELHGDDEDRLVTWLCEAGYGARGFDDNIFEYLYKHYDGSMDLLVDIFRACNAYQKDASLVEERILKKAMDTGEHPEVVWQVFRRYYDHGQDRALIRKYLEYRCGLYLYHIMKGIELEEHIADTGFFDYIERDMMLSRHFDDDCVIAYLLYHTETQELNEKQIRNIEKHLKDLVRRGKMLEEFKYYRRFFVIPSTLANNIIISAFSENPDSRPLITYEISGPSNTVSGTEEMEEIFRRCYVKYFTLFYGEKVIFSMDGQSSTAVRYADLQIRHDGSRYAKLDDIIRLKEVGSQEAFSQAVREFYVKEQLIDRLL